MTLHAEKTIDPSVLMRGEAHVVDIRAGIFGVGHCDGTLAEFESVDSVVALGYSEE